MREVRLGANPGLDHLEVCDVAEPGAPGPGEIAVRIAASSLNRHDHAVALGRMGADVGRVLLADAAGTVTAVGPGVAGFAVGDAVIACFFPDWEDGDNAIDSFARTPGDGIDGFAADQVVRPARWFTRAPAHMSLEEAATLTTAGLTAWRALVACAALQPGQTLLVLGTSSVSVIALQLAKAIGARVIVTSSSDAKLETMRALGADLTVNYVTYPEWGDEVLRLTGGRGADVTLEMGGAGTLDQSITATRIGGAIVLIGVMAGRSGHVATSRLMYRQIRLMGIVVGSRAHQIAMIEDLERYAIRPVIAQRFALPDLADAFRAMEAADYVGKIVITMG